MSRIHAYVELECIVNVVGKGIKKTDSIHRNARKKTNAPTHHPPRSHSRTHIVKSASIYSQAFHGYRKDPPPCFSNCLHLPTFSSLASINTTSLPQPLYSTISTEGSLPIKGFHKYGRVC